MLLLFWVVFFLTITNQLYSIYGIPYLFLYPEYMGKGGYISFAWVGVSFGAFIITWNLVLYILNSFRFHFLASLRYPFFTFSLNNATIPLLFLLVYLIAIIRFQKASEYISNTDLILDIAGFLVGFIFMVVINGIYFRYANRDVMSLMRRSKKSLKRLTRTYQKNRSEKFVILSENESPFLVRSYIAGNFKIRLARNVSHYDPEMLNDVFQQHHWNAVLIQFVSLLTLVFLGIFIEVPVFQLPSAANIFLAFASFVSIYGLFKFWSGRWSTTAFIVVFVLINIITKYSYLTYQSKVIGLDYNGPSLEYSLPVLNKLASKKNCDEDVSSMVSILNNWKTKNTQNKAGKPKIVFVCASGGGLRSTMFTMATLQKIDQQSQGQLMNQTFLMTGASGGIQAIAYYRELYYRRLSDITIDIDNEHYTYNIAKDLINALTASITTNDLFYPWRNLKSKDNTYKKDRGYMWEFQLNRNCENWMNKTLGDYVIPEKNASIPLLLTYPVLTNDARFLFIGSQPMRFLMRPFEDNKDKLSSTIDGIDYLSYFALKHPLQMPITTSIRMNATYPWILPNAVFPTTPQFTVMDAGIRDNFGMGVTARFIHAFKNWIEENTSGVVIVQIRAYEKNSKIVAVDKKSWLAKVGSPFGTIGNNLSNLHDYNNDALLSLLDQNLLVPLTVIPFEYVPEKDAENTSMSFRLTTKEKKDILRATNSNANISSLNQLLDILTRQK